MQPLETFSPKSRDDWRAWLLENHDKKMSVWLIYFKAKSGKPSVSYSDAVDEALCFGWIDSKAKRNGSWTILDDAEALVIPDDLNAAFASQPGSRAFFDGLSRSDKRNILQWLILAKRAETRAKRISAIVENAGMGRKPI